MASNAFSQFMKSLELDYDRWHDGERFDLEALAKIDDSERGDVVRELARRTPTWREVEALEEIDLAAAVMAIERALEHSDSSDTRLAAIAALDRLEKLEVPADELLALEIRELTSVADGCSRALLMAEDYPTDRVRQALLAASRAKTECAIHCAGVLCYLAGVAKEPFDWDLRPLFLRLGPDERDADRAAAFAELCTLVRMEPDAT